MSIGKKNSFFFIIVKLSISVFISSQKIPSVFVILKTDKNTTPLLSIRKLIIFDSFVKQLTATQKKSILFREKMVLL